MRQNKAHSGRIVYIEKSPALHNVVSLHLAQSFLQFKSKVIGYKYYTPDRQYK